MSPDTFRLIIAICALWVTFGYLAANAPLTSLAALLCGSLWLLYILCIKARKWWYR